MRKNVRLLNEINGYPVYLHFKDCGFNLKCNGIKESDYTLIAMIQRKHDNKNKLFGMIVKLVDVEKVYYEAKCRDEYQLFWNRLLQ